MMRRAVTGAAIVLLLASCDSPADPNDGKSAPPTATESTSTAKSTARAKEADLRAICDALKDTVKLPTNGTVQYTAEFNKPKGWVATNLPLCGIEPVGEYYDVAAKAPVFGRARFDYGILTADDEKLMRRRHPEYTPEKVQELLTLDQAEPLGDLMPCAAKPCKNGIHGYMYNFRFETMLDNIAVDAKFDYITTDVSGDKKSQYRTQAIEAFTASMDVIVTGLQ